MFLIPLTLIRQQAEESLTRCGATTSNKLSRSERSFADYMLDPVSLLLHSITLSFLPWLSRTSVGKRNLLTITSNGSDTELHESPVMLADSFSIFHPSPSSSSRASRGRNGTGVRNASRHDEEKRVRETPKWCDLNRTHRGARHPPSSSSSSSRTRAYRNTGLTVLSHRYWRFIPPQNANGSLCIFYQRRKTF